MKKVLLFSSVCKPKSILEVSLPSYAALLQESFQIDLLFYDDNKETASQDYLAKFCKKQLNCKQLEKVELNKTDYEEHQWNPSRIDRIIIIKNQAIQYALNNGYDYLFLVDADLVLHPNTVANLILQDRHFIFSVFWTLFYGETIHKPNAWDHHSWSYKNAQSILRLSQKGNYIVGGGGACTLLSREILSKGLTFNRLPSLYYQGEDRHFCTRAQALGYDVVVNTDYPAYHIFREEQCHEAHAWYDKGAKPDFYDSWLNSEWEAAVNKSFEKKNLNFFYKLKQFQYTVRKSFKKIFINDQ